MVTPPTPTCWRCGGPVFNHWLRGYICPYCRQLDATRKVAKEAERARKAQEQVHYQEPVYYEQPAHYAQSNDQNDDGVIGDVIASGIGCLIVLFVFTAIASVIIGIWQAIVYPLLHFISFGLI